MNEQMRIPDLGTFTVVSVKNERGCVDPRPADTTSNKPDHHSGAERTPGASMGLAMALLGAVDIDPKTAVIATLAFESQENHPFVMHTDNCGHELGCGHILRAKNTENESLYGIPSGKVEEMIGIAKDLANKGTLELEMPVLKGQHKEEAVVKVVDKKKTIEATNAQHHVFRLDTTRTEETFARFEQFVRTKGKLTVENGAIQRAADRQGVATLTLLAAEKNIFVVSPSSKRVDNVGTVPTPDQFLHQLAKSQR